MGFQIGSNQFLKQGVPLHPADQAPGGIVTGDVGWIAGNDVPHQLIHRIVSLYLQGLVDKHQDVPRIVAGSDNRIMLHGVELILHTNPPCLLLCSLLFIIPFSPRPDKRFAPVFHVFSVPGFHVFSGFSPPGSLVPGPLP